MTYDLAADRAIIDAAPDSPRLSASAVDHDPGGNTAVTLELGEADWGLIEARRFAAFIAAARTRWPAALDALAVEKARADAAEAEVARLTALVHAKESWIDGAKVDLDALDAEKARADAAEAEVARLTPACTCTPYEAGGDGGWCGMSDDDLTFASSGPAGVHYARCWGCMCGSHYDPPQRHDWADSDDIEHAAKTGQPSPRGKRCACRCAEESA